jgi:hypothetical protein
MGGMGPVAAAAQAGSQPPDSPQAPDDAASECTADDDDLDDTGDDVSPEIRHGMTAEPGFRPGSIHKSECVQFWKQVLLAPAMIVGILEEGYRLPFVTRPEEGYEEQNNKSARQDMAFVRQTVKEWEQQGVIKLVDSQPKAVSPLTVATRLMADGTEKKRLCWDGSRFINPRLKKFPVNLAHLQTALEITEEGDFQTKYDLTQAFFHIKIWEGDHQFLGASFDEESGAKRFFVFTHMPFGLATAVHAITKVMKPIQAYFAKSGLRHSIYIDDGRVVASSKSLAQEHTEFVYDTLTKAGWQIAIQKSDRPDQATQVQEYLGFTIDTRNMTVSLPEAKKAQLLQLSRDLAASGGRCLKAKELASMVGKLTAAEPALGNFATIMGKRAYGILEEAVSRQGWRGTVRISAEVAADFRTVGEQLAEHDHHPIRSKATEISVVSIIGPPTDFLKRKFLPNHKTEGQVEVWCGDASATAVCAFSVTSNQPFFFKAELSAFEAQQSSGYRELMTLKHALEFLSGSRTEVHLQKTIYWMTDSENLVSFLTKGSMKTAIQEEVVKVLQQARHLNLTIVPIHLRREDPRIKIADAGSKSLDSDNWSIHSQDFAMLALEFGPFTVDLFADDTNHKVGKFYSEFFTPLAAGVDALAHDWSNEHCWVCPPVKLLIKVIRKIRQQSCSGVLIAPEWHTGKFWPFIMKADGHPVSPFKRVIRFRPYIIQNGDARSSLRGRPHFAMLALEF